MRHRVAVKLQEKETIAVGQCHHHWVIEEANGPRSVGTCKFCGENKDFYNAMPDFNALRRNASLLNLPEIPEVEVGKDNKS